MGKWIEIYYQRWGEVDSRLEIISEGDDYDPLEVDHDPSPSEDHSFARDGVARYQEPHRYLGVDPLDLQWLVLKEPKEDGLKVFRYQYFKGVESFMVHASWPDGTEETILSTRVTEDLCHLTRTLKEPGQNWSTTLNVVSSLEETLTRDQEDRSGLWTFEELKAFGSIGNGV